jgi:hypothetical protein
MSRQGQLAAEPRRPPSGPAPIDQRGDQLFGRALDAGRSSARARLDGSRNAANTMLTAVELLLNDSYNILIILDRARRARRKPTVLFEVLCEWAASIGPATISSPFSGAGALRVVYAPLIIFSMRLVSDQLWARSRRPSPQVSAVALVQGSKRPAAIPPNIT